MIRYDVEQGTDEWLELRLGIPTASAFRKIITPKTLKLSSSAGKYMADLLVERRTGRPLEDDGSTAFMGRGSELEAEARRAYSFETGRAVELVGFVTTDDGRAGGSPDGLVNPGDGLLEIKCRSASRHIEVQIGTLAPASPTQLQGYLWLTSRAWVDVWNYCPGMDPHLVRFERDLEVIEKIESAVTAFADTLDRQAERLGIGAPDLPF